MSTDAGSVGHEEQERRLLSEFERQFGMPMYREMADLAFQNYQAVGEGRAILQGLDREQRDLMRRWGQWLERRQAGALGLE